ncbi:MAG: MltA domain-containing protein [Pigmentiphaga sp.]|uniref:murein transglycosylase A n=1 Tax=Pigmentiphaga sp. TaxID=1977564 RepID=UPI0029A9E645|nr:MltA domain-containing protein [Pigmentiphaga sp.]MDX3905760.1 MltA domain-containing protein [Pigmentiphaga sp.]
MSLRDFVAKTLHCPEFNRFHLSALAFSALVAGCAQPPGSAPPSPGVPAPAVPTAPAQPPTATPEPDSVRPLPAPVPRPANRPALQSSKHFSRASWTQLPGWKTDPVDSLWRPFMANCRSIMQRTGSPISNTAPPLADPYAWQRTCAAARELPTAPPAEQVRAFLEQWLQPWSVRGPGGEQAVSLATSYYEPLVHASRERGGAYQWPLYAVPTDLLTIDLGSLYPELVGKRIRGKLDGKRVVPYDTRSEIERPERQPPAIVWVDDPVDAFFLQVQGTGRAILDTGPGQGSTIRLAYADHNGHPYISIGKWLIDKGELSMAQASMQGIRTWAQRNPGRVKEMLNANPAVVFFREEAVIDPTEGPKGAMGLPLTPHRSVAVDPSIVPLGTPVFLATTQPNSRQPMNLAALAQDTGSAIKGPARVDLFWGFGQEAGEMAGRMKQPSRLWVLWPKDEGVPAPAR